MRHKKDKTKSAMVVETKQEPNSCSSSIFGSYLTLFISEVLGPCTLKSDDQNDQITLILPE